MASSLSPRILRVLIALCLGVPTLAAVGLKLFGKGSLSWSFVGILAAITVLGWAIAGVCGSRGVSAMSSLAIVLALLLYPEMLLRVVGVDTQSAGQVQFGFPRPERMITLKKDPELFWRLPPEDPTHNSLGFRGREWEIPKPEGRLRVAFFGDSCTYQPYPFRVEARLRKHFGDRRSVDIVNLGVPGYTSHQGRILVDRWAEKLKPDIAVVYFGWNDHWQAYGDTDRQKAARAAEGGPGWGARVLKSSALVHGLLSLLAPAEAVPLEVPRVPEEDFRDNLLTMGRELQELGIHVLMITAPGTHAILGVPEYLTKRGFAASNENVVAWHARYAQAVREIAEQSGWDLLDLEAQVAGLQNVEEYFIQDGIHFSTPRGLDWIAEAIASRVIEVVDS